METAQPLCPCKSGKLYAECCQPFHKGKLPDTALELMRSRYAAFALNIPEYIIATTHPGSPQYSDNPFVWKREITRFATAVTFQRLDILDFKEFDTVASVTFTAYLTHKEQDSTFTEKSYFEKIRGKWLYRGGHLAEGHAPNLVTNRQFKLLPLAYYGDPILRKKADPIVEINDDIKKLINDMIETMEACDGIGISAPQVHHSIRLFVFRKPIEKEGENLQYGDIQVFINPTLSSPSKETIKMSEGCLSIPALYGEVERPKTITVEYTNLNGERITEQLSGMHARVVMHENDHINGTLFIDRMNDAERAKIKPFLANLAKRVHPDMRL